MNAVQAIAAVNSNWHNTERQPGRFGSPCQACPDAASNSQPHQERMPGSRKTYKRCRRARARAVGSRRPPHPAPTSPRGRSPDKRPMHLAAFPTLSVVAGSVTPACRGAVPAKASAIDGHGHVDRRRRRRSPWPRRRHAADKNRPARSRTRRPPCCRRKKSPARKFPLPRCPPSARSPAASRP